MIGLAIVIAILAGRAEYRNHSVLASFLLILMALHDPKYGFMLLRLQVSLIYFGAGLNKILDPDWLNGQFFEFWTHQRLQHGPYMLLASMFPPRMLSSLFSWTTIFLEFMIAAGFLIPRLYSRTVWLGVFLHGSIMVFTADSANLQGLFGYFFPVAVSSYLVFYRWPESPMKVQYDPRHPLSLWLQKTSWWMDPDRSFHWQPVPDSAAESGRSHYLQLQTQNKTYRDFKAVQVFLLWSPLTYLGILLGFLSLFRALPIVVGFIWGSRYIPLGAPIKILYFLVPVIFFFPLWGRWLDSWIQKWGKAELSRVNP